MKLLLGLVWTGIPARGLIRIGFLLTWGFSRSGGMPEWLKGTGCKPVGYAYVGSNPTPSTIGTARVGLGVWARRRSAGVAQW